MNTRRSTRTKAIDSKAAESEIKENSNVTKNKANTKKLISDEDDGSSSDSSVGDYLKKADEIDLNSSFFDTNNTAELNNFQTVEKKILNEVKQLSDSSDSDEAENVSAVEKEEPVFANKNEKESKKCNFAQLREYNKKIEEAKACVANYKKKMSENEHKVDISQILSLGETKIGGLETTAEISDHDMDTDDENDWEEIEEKDADAAERVNIPKEGVQITVALPNVVRKKKGVDFIAAVKRRINRIKKENQVYVHKVHLLCWIAHGNFLNSVLNSENLMGLGLSLLPSENCYPPKHADIKYLEQIVKWYGKMMKLKERSEPDNETPLEEALQSQITKKEAWSKKEFVLIFIIILRSLGLQCRLVLSLQCLPLRPPSEELCSLSAKKEEKTQSNNQKVKESNVAQATPSTSTSSTSVTVSSKSKATTSKVRPTKAQKNKANTSASKTSSSREIVQPKEGKSSTPKKAISKNEAIVKESKSKSGDVKSSTRTSSRKSSNKSNIRIPQVDGADDEDIASTATNTRKPNLKKLREKIEVNTEKGKVKSVKGKNEGDIRKPDLKSLKNKVETVSKKPNLRNLKEKEESSSKKPDLKKLRAVQTKRISAEVQSDSNKEGSDPDFKTDINKNKSKKRKITLTDKPSAANLQKLGKKLDVRQDIINIIKDQMVEQKYAAAKKLVKKHKRYESDDSDYVPEPDVKRRKSSGSEKDFKVNVNVKRRVKPRSEIDRRVLSTDDDDSNQEPKKKKGNDFWIEVFLEAEEKWISADVIKSQVHCVSELYSRASQPVSYILAWNNNLSIKDVSARYCSRWNTVTRKLRVDAAWWKETLKPYIGVRTLRDREEDEDLARQQLDQPLPTTISEYKDHPLYVLKRHLLKFQGIYPPDALTLGFVRNEPVYSRDCVYTLHSREIWVKHAKVVKPGQTPYKIVKARPKYDKLSGTVISDQPLELFGIWQVEDYVPPVAENGIVPRNAFGNVELFKACMLPTGTVHLQLPGLNKIARKLNIDCAPAVVGFDFHGGWSHPTFDGFVVCEEFKDTLIAAWEEDQVETARKEQEKIEKRVYDNWRKLIKGLLIRERLKARYDFGDSSTSGAGKAKKPKGSKLVLKKRRIHSDDETE